MIITHGAQNCSQGNPSHRLVKALLPSRFHINLETYCTHWGWMMLDQSLSVGLPQPAPRQVLGSVTPLCP